MHDQKSQLWLSRSELNTPADLCSQAASSSPSGTSADSPSSTSKPSGDSNNGWSQGVIAGVVVAAVAIVVAIIVAWWKPHQCLWLISCGMFGHRHTNIRPSHSQNGIPLSNMGPPPYYRPHQPPQNFHINFNNSNNHLHNGGYHNPGGYAPMGPVYR